MSPEAHARLVEIDDVARALREFYEYAAAVLPASTLRERCQRLARAKAEIVAIVALRLPQPRGQAAAVDLDAAGDETVDGTQPPRSALAQRIGRGLARARGGLATPDPSRLWDELQRVEDALAEACRQSAVDSGDVDSRRELAWLLPLLERCRDEFAPAASG